MQDQIFSLKIDGAFCQVGLKDLQDLDYCAEKFLNQNNLSMCYKDKLVQRFKSFFEMFVQNDQEKENQTQKKFYNNQAQEILDDETEKQIKQINQSYYDTLQQSDKVFERLYKDSLRRKRKKQKIIKTQNEQQNKNTYEKVLNQQKTLEDNNQKKETIKKVTEKSNRFEELYKDALNQQLRQQRKIQGSLYSTKQYLNEKSNKILQESSIPRNFYHRVIYQKNMRQRSLNKIKSETQYSFHPKTNKTRKPKSQDNMPHYQKLYMLSKKQNKKQQYQYKRPLSQNSQSIVNIQVKALANQYFSDFKDIFTENIKAEQIDLNSIKPNRLQILTPLLLEMNQYNHDINRLQFECLFQQFYKGLNLLDKQELQNKSKTKQILTEHLFKPKLNPKSIKLAKNRKFNNLFQKKEI